MLLSLTIDSGVDKINQLRFSSEEPTLIVAKFAKPQATCNYHGKTLILVDPFIGPWIDRWLVVINDKQVRCRVVSSIPVPQEYRKHLPQDLL
jgi:hypothetical protein